MAFYDNLMIVKVIETKQMLTLARVIRYKAVWMKEKSHTFNRHVRFIDNQLISHFTPTPAQTSPAVMMEKNMGDVLSKKVNICLL